MDFQRRGVMLVIASPSGAGKTSITRALMERDGNLALSVSVTTRPPRRGEIDGVDYRFISIDTFETMRAAGHLLESAEVHGNFYGTPRAEVDERIAAGADVVFDIDWQGTTELYESCRGDMATVFVLPPSIAELKARLETRAQNSPEEIARRLKNARAEMDHWDEYDYVIINRDLDEAVDRVEAFLNAARNARERQIDLASFVKDLQTQIDSIQ